jgi:CelD/BcsL family acetyltransferase involved in cellulose biosynthesis
MADATASSENNGRTTAMAAQGAPSTGAATAVVSAASADSVARYEAFCAAALHAPAQGGPWVRHWVDEVRPDAVLAMLAVDRRPVLALALEVMRAGPFRVARFMGGRHANGNFAPVAPGWLGGVDRAAIRPLFDAIARSRPDIDVLALQRLLPDLDGAANPLATLAGHASPNLSLAVDLTGGFEAVLDRTSGRRKSKKHRAQARKFEAAGGFRRIEAGTADEVRALLDAFFAMKEQRFRRMGIANVFADAKVRVFFHALFAAALLQEKPSFVLHGLEVGGKLRAVTGSSISGKRLICEFGAIADDELGHASPGEFLFFENIEEACADGFGVYDFSVGDEPYKRQWCDMETRHRDVLVPLTLKGRALAFGLHRHARLKAFVKNNPAVWGMAKKLRRKAAGKQAASEDAG